MAQLHPREGFDLDIAYRQHLDLREAANLGLGKADVVECLRCDGGDTRVDFRLAQPETRRCPPIEARGIVAHRGLATRLDVIDDVLDRRAHGGIGSG